MEFSPPAARFQFRIPLGIHYEYPLVGGENSIQRPRADYYLESLVKISDCYLDGNSCCCRSKLLQWPLALKGQSKLHLTTVTSPVNNLSFSSPAISYTTLR